MTTAATLPSMGSLGDTSLDAWFILVVFIVGLVVFARTLSRGEFFVVAVRRGEVLHLRGRIPPGLLADIASVVKRPPVARARLSAEVQGNLVRLRISGDIDENRRQRLRNLLGLRTQPELRGAPAVRAPSWGQRLGWAWLAWRSEDRRKVR
jgi:hypothetical protein